jgi:hypothetical protein
MRKVYNRIIQSPLTYQLKIISTTLNDAAGIPLLSTRYNADMNLTNFIIHFPEGL